MSKPFPPLDSLSFVDVLPTLPSSLVTGSRSHKLVTSDVSRILWYYYNDSVRVFLNHTLSLADVA